MSWRESVARMVRLPEAPTAPPGEGSTIVFRAAPNFFRFRQILWILRQISGFIGLIFGVLFIRRLLHWEDLPELAGPVLIAGEVIAWVVWIAQVPLSWMVMRLDYELRWYIVTDRSLRIREGIMRVKEKTMAFANIQNIAIRQGPFQRLLGIADVEVRNAGGGSGSEAGAQGKAHLEPMHVGYFRGVDNAEAIRDILREGVRTQRDAGLGDPDEEVPDHAGDADALEPALEILANLKAARAALQAGST